jgi:hypothetical protein
LSKALIARNLATFSRTPGIPTARITGPDLPVLDG